MTTRRVQVVVEGRVQGVFFRAYTEDEARRLGLTGWVRNRRDGAVEALIEGDAQRVTEMVSWLHRGSPQAVVSQVQVTDADPLGDFTDFSIRY